MRRLTAGFSCALVFFLLAPARAFAQIPVLAYMGESPLVVEPRSRAAIALRAENQGAEKAEFSVEAILPEGWNLLTAPAPLELDPGASELVILSVFVPLQTPRGHYQADFLLKSEAGGEVSRVSVTISVANAVALKAQILEQPLTCKAGGSYLISYSVTNSGNTALSVTAAGRSDSRMPFAFVPPEAADFSLGPGETASMGVMLYPPAQSYEVYQHRFVLELSASGADGRSIEPIILRSMTEIIPSVAGRTSQVHILPATVSATGFGASGDEPNIGAGLTLDLSGTLDAARQHHLDLHLQKTVQSRIPGLVDPQDKYYALYKYRFISLGLGDRSFQASDLAGGRRSGFGLTAAGAFGAEKAGAFQLGGALFADRQVWQKPLLAMLYAEWAPSLVGPSAALDYRLRAAMSSSLGENLVYGLRQSLRPLAAMDLSLELAAGDRLDGSFNPAFLLESKGDWEAWYYQARAMAAWPGFPGSGANSLDLQMSGGARLLETRLQVWASYRQADRNLLGLASEANDRTDIDAFLDASYAFASGGLSLSLGSGARWRTDALDPPEANEWALRLRAGAKQVLPLDGSLMGYAELWPGRDGITQSSFAEQRYGMDFNMSPFKDFRVSAGALAQIRDILGSSAYDAANISWSAGTSYSFSRMDLGLSLRNAYQIDGGALATASFDLVGSLKYAFPWGHWADFSISAGVGGTTGTNGLGFEIKYTAPFGIPIREKVDTGLLRVRVVDEVAQAPLPDAIVRLGKTAAVTNGQGVAVFRVAKPGSYFLYLDRNSLPPGYMPRLGLPVEAGIELEKEVEVLIPVTPAASVRGRLRVLDFSSALAGFSEASEEQDQYLERERVPSIIVELSDGQSRQRQACDSSGSFSFVDLPSGEWTLRVLEESLPERHYAETPLVELELAPAQEGQVEIRILPLRRTIQVTEDLGLLNAE